MRTARSYFSRALSVVTLVVGSWSRSLKTWGGRHGGLLLVLAFAACYLLPTLSVSYNCDDLANSLVPGMVQLQGISLLKFTRRVIRGWMCGGRFIPLALLITYGVHGVFVTHETAYRCFVLTLVLMDLVLFYRALRASGNSRSLAQLTVFGLVLLLQLRDCHDPILSYAGLLQILAAEWLCAIIFWQAYLQRRRPAWLWASTAALLAALLTYEISYALLPLFALMAYGRECSAAAAARHAGVPALAAALLVVFTLGLRDHMPPNPDDPYQPVIQPATVARTAFDQAGSALPLSYLASESGQVMLSLERCIARWDNWAVLLLAAAVAAILLRQYGRDPHGQCRSPGLLALCGLLLWILPGLPIALSPKYQASIAFGYAYLPVFVQYFGFAVLALAAWLLLARKLPRPARRVMAWTFMAASACVALVHYDTGRQVVSVKRSDHFTPERWLIEAALRSGLADEVAAGATVWFPKHYPWLYGELRIYGSHLTEWLGRRVFAVAGPPAGGWLGDPLRVAEIPFPAHALHVFSETAGSGCVVLAEIVPRAPDGDAVLTTRRVQVFVQGRFLELAAAQDRLSLVTAADSEQGPATLLDFSRLTLVRRRQEGAIYEGTFDQPVDVASLAIHETSPSARLAATPRPVH